MGGGGGMQPHQLALMANWLTMATCKLVRHWAWAIRHKTLIKFIIIIIIYCVIPENIQTHPTDGSSD